MAKTRKPPPPAETPADDLDSYPASSYGLVFILSKWWLFWSDKEACGKRLAVGGVEIKKSQAARIITSAPILTRIDSTILEAADDITLVLRGDIDHTRTQENGISSEVCESFETGFPDDWDKYAPDIGSKLLSTCTPKSADGVDKQVENTPDKSITRSDTLANLDTEADKASFDQEIPSHDLDGTTQTEKIARQKSSRRSYVPEVLNKQPVGYGLRSRLRSHDAKTKLQNMSIAEGKDTDKKVATSVNVEMKEEASTSVESNPKGPHEVSNDYKHDRTMKSKFSSKKDKTMESPSALSTSDNENQLQEDQRGVRNRKTASVRSRGGAKASCDQEMLPEDPNPVKQMKEDESYTGKEQFGDQAVLQTPVTHDMTNNGHISSPDELNLKKSRSGRVIVPPIDHYRQQIIYDMDRNNVGIITVDRPSSTIKAGSKSAPQRKRKNR